MNSSGRSAIWSPEAVADLDAIWAHYLGVAGRTTAERIVRDVGRVILVIEEHPHAGRARDELRQGVRSIAATPNVVFYRVVNNAPQIIRVLDGRRDVDAIFSEIGGT